MGIFKRRNSLKKRVASLEEYIGAVYVHKSDYDYNEHQVDQNSYNNTIEGRLKKVENSTKKGKK